MGAGAGRPFSPELDPLDPPLDGELQQHLQGRVGPGTAANHARLAEAATTALEDTVSQDLHDLGKTKDDFRCFLAFAGEVVDRYGRLLAYLHPDQADQPAEQRKLSYNERLLAAGWVSPYFIWPNVNPFRRAPSVAEAVPAPGSAVQLAARERSLRQARRWVQQARDRHAGLYEQQDPLRLLPFELRLLARRWPPDRWVVDLGRGDDVLVPPQFHFEVANPEDRLFVPAEYVPLFVERGWRRG